MLNATISIGRSAPRHQSPASVTVIVIQRAGLMLASELEMDIDGRMDDGQVSLSLGQNMN
jgi:hypothetical protein